MSNPIHVTVWHEFRHEKKPGKVQSVYPYGMHTIMAQAFQADPQFRVRTATLDEPEHGLTDEVLEATDVLTWWGHMAHDEVQEVIVEKVAKRVLEGMGLMVLHSGHYSKIFRKLMGTECNLRWREADEKERVWVVDPSHPIAAGLGNYFEVPQSEMYGEYFDIPTPDELVFISWFQGGEVFRSGCTFKRGKGKIFYFSPGHETYPIYHQPEVQQVLRNAAKWAAPNDHAAFNRQVIAVETLMK
jgi:trehalose utilization protein